GAVAASFLGAWYLRDIVPAPGHLAPLTTYVSTVPMFVGAAGFALLVTIDLLGLRVFGSAPAVTSTTIAIYQVGALLARSAYFIGDALIDGAFPHIARHGDSR